ncbi:MAG: folylpolyglutamate synthase/dihydrofolate synthase family protein [Nocardioidaceae bacterium]
MPTSPESSAAADVDELYRDVERAMLDRWPETKLDPSLDRIAALCDLLGQPQRAYPVIQLTGTNGKTTTARMVDTLVRGLGLRTGRFTSPHVESMTERISIDGEPLSKQRFAEVYEEVLPYAAIIDRSGGIPMSFFELVTAMAFAAFADAPVDVGVIEVGMGGTWDATNVAGAAIGIITPIGVDHERYLGDTPADIAVEKAGILKSGTVGIIAQQPVEAAEVLMRHAAQVGAMVAREGLEFGVRDRVPGVGGQMVTFQGLRATYDEVFLPLHGAHQAHNAACALAAVESFAGGAGGEGGLDIELVRQAFAQVTSPGRLEIVRRSPTVVLDSAHNPHGARASAEAVQEAFVFSPLIGVVGVMADKDVEGVLEAYEPVMSHIICTQNSTSRAMPAETLADIARGIFGADRVDVQTRLDDAIEAGIGMAEDSGGDGFALGGGGVLVTGSVITAGEARTLLGGGR